MRDHCFGRKIKLPSTISIKHQLLTMMFNEEIRAIPPGGLFKENESPALAMLQRLKGGIPRAALQAEGAAGKRDGAADATS